MKALASKPITREELLRRSIAVVLDDAFIANSVTQFTLNVKSFDDLVDKIAVTVERVQRPEINLPKLRRKIAAIVEPIYFDKIPYDQLAKAVEEFGFDETAIPNVNHNRVALDGERWAFDIANFHMLVVTVYPMPSGRIEVLAYVS
jgi:hypothetical protein